MGLITLLEDFNPWNTKPQAVAPFDPKIETKPNLNDEEIEIRWKSPSYHGEWCLAGPERSKHEAVTISKEMKSAETGSQPVVDRLPPIDTFMATYAQKLNPHGWTLDFFPEDLDWTTEPPLPVNEAVEASPLPKFIADAGGKLVEPTKLQRSTYKAIKEPFYKIEQKLGKDRDGNEVDVSILFFKDKTFIVNGPTQGWYSGFGGKWKENSSKVFDLAGKKIKGVELLFDRAFARQLPS